MNAAAEREAFTSRNPHFGFREANALMAENGMLPDLDPGTSIVYRGEQAEWRAEDTAEALRQHLRTTGAHTRYLVAADLASMTRAELIELHDDMPVTADSCRDCPSNYR